MQKIYFCRTTDAYGFLSNFYICPYEVDGIKYLSSEHYYQAHKQVPINLKVLNTKNAMAAAIEGRRSALRPDWDSVRNEIMYEALFYKFLKNLVLLNSLIKTQGKQLIEYSTKDSYWGNGGNDTGQNKLGQLLMAIRDRFILGW